MALISKTRDVLIKMSKFLIGLTLPICYNFKDVLVMHYNHIFYFIAGIITCLVIRLAIDAYYEVFSLNTLNTNLQNVKNVQNRTNIANRMWTIFNYSKPFQIMAVLIFSLVLTYFAAKHSNETVLGWILPGLLAFFLKPSYDFLKSRYLEVRDSYWPTVTVRSDEYLRFGAIFATLCTENFISGPRARIYSKEILNGLKRNYDDEFSDSRNSEEGCDLGPDGAPLDFSGVSGGKKDGGNPSGGPGNYGSNPSGGPGNYGSNPSGGPQIRKNFMLASGVYKFLYKGQVITAKIVYDLSERTRKSHNILKDNLQNSITLSTFSITGSLDLIEQYIAQAEAKIKNERKNYIFVHSVDAQDCDGNNSRYGNENEKQRYIIHRPLSSVILKSNSNGNLSENMAESLLKICKTFISRQKEYRARSIPHRTGFIFKGCPGTGKSTTAFALACELNADLQLVPASWFKRHNTLPEFPGGEVDRVRVIVIEDVDSALTPSFSNSSFSNSSPQPARYSHSKSQRSIPDNYSGIDSFPSNPSDNNSPSLNPSDNNSLPSDKDNSIPSDHSNAEDNYGSFTEKDGNGKDGQYQDGNDKDGNNQDGNGGHPSSLEREPPSSFMNCKKNGRHNQTQVQKTVDRNSKRILSNITNALDGIEAQENCIVIMTTNHYEELPEALTRAGRVNKTFEFTKMDADQIRRLFKRFYRHSFSSSLSSTISNSGLPSAFANHLHLDLDVLENSFCKLVEPDVYPPAFLEQHLLKYMDDPVGAIRNIDEMKNEYELNQQQFNLQGREADIEREREQKALGKRLGLKSRQKPSKNPSLLPNSLPSNSLPSNKIPIVNDTNSINIPKDILLPSEEAQVINDKNSDHSSSVQSFNSNLL